MLETTYCRSIGEQDIQVDRQTAPAHWENTRRRLAGSFYLSEAFARIMEKQGNSPLFFSWMENQQPTGIALGFLTNQWRRWPGNVIARGFYWQTHPAVAGNDQLTQNQFVEAILKIVERIGVTSIHLHSEDACLSPALSKSPSLQSRDRIEFRLKLTDNPADVMVAMNKNQRQNLRTSLNTSGVDVIEVTELDSIRMLLDFQDTSRERRRARGEDYEVASKKAADSILNDYLIPGHARLFISRRDGKPLSGALIHVDGHSAYYSMSGCSTEGFQANAPRITLWRAIEHLCADGYATFNLGGVAASSIDPQDLGHGLYRFKRSFGGDEVRCTTWHKDMTGWRSALSKRLF